MGDFLACRRLLLDTRRACDRSFDRIRHTRRHCDATQASLAQYAKVVEASEALLRRFSDPGSDAMRRDATGLLDRLSSTVS